MAISVTDFGAKGDKKANDQKAIQKAIDTCGAAGGGTVVVPQGTYRTGTIKLATGVELHLEAGAVLQGIDNEKNFPIIRETPFGNLPGHIRALLWAEDVDDVSVTGMGTIDGGGDSVIEDPQNCTFRPALVFFRNCKRVRFTDVRLHYSCFWTLHLLRCHDVNIRGISIVTNVERTNTDGIDPDGCTNVRISDCTIVSGDDAICIKSTEGDVCENITVTNCIVSSKCAALKLGTEAVGDIRNVLFSNCIVRDSNVGIAMYQKDGSTYENVRFSNCVIEADSEFPIIIDITPRYHSDPKVGAIRNVTLESINMKSRGRIYVEGRPEKPIERFVLRNVTCDVTGACKTTEIDKPAGARRVELDPDRANYALKPYHFLGICLKDAMIENLALVDRRPERTTDRSVLYLKDVKNMTMSYRSDLSISSKKPEMLKEGCDEVRLITHRGR